MDEMCFLNQVFSEFYEKMIMKTASGYYKVIKLKISYYGKDYSLLQSKFDPLSEILQFHFLCIIP